MDREKRKANLKKLQLPSSSKSRKLRSATCPLTSETKISEFFNTPNKIIGNEPLNTIQNEEPESKEDQVIVITDNDNEPIVSEPPNLEGNENQPKRPKRSKLTNFVYKNKEDIPDHVVKAKRKLTINDFETVDKIVKKAPQIKTAKSGSKSRSKKQQTIKSAFLRNEQIFSEIAAQHCIAENFSPDEMQMALIISKSEAEVNGVLCENSEKEVVDLLNKDISEQNETIRTKLRKYGFRTAAKEEYNAITAAFLPGARSRTKTKWANKFTALTLRNPEYQLKKIKENIETFMKNHNFPLNEINEPNNEPLLPYRFVSKGLHKVFIEDKRLKSTHLGKSETSDENVLERFFVTDLFPTSEVKPGYLLKNWNAIQGRDLSPQKDDQKTIEKNKKLEEIYKELGQLFETNKSKELSETSAPNKRERSKVSHLLKSNKVNNIETAELMGDEKKRIENQMETVNHIENIETSDGNEELDAMVELIENGIDQHLEPKEKNGCEIINEAVDSPIKEPPDKRPKIVDCQNDNVPNPTNKRLEFHEKTTSNICLENKKSLSSPHINENNNITCENGFASGKQSAPLSLSDQCKEQFLSFNLQMSSLENQTKTQASQQDFVYVTQQRSNSPDLFADSDENEDEIETKHGITTFEIYSSDEVKNSLEIKLSTSKIQVENNQSSKTLIVDLTQDENSNSRENQKTFLEENPVFQQKNIPFLEQQTFESAAKRQKFKEPVSLGEQSQHVEEHSKSFDQVEKVIRDSEEYYDLTKDTPPDNESETTIDKPYISSCPVNDYECTKKRSSAWENIGSNTSDLKAKCLRSKSESLVKSSFNNEIIVPVTVSSEINSSSRISNAENESTNGTNVLNVKENGIDSDFERLSFSSDSAHMLTSAKDINSTSSKNALEMENNNEKIPIDVFDLTQNSTPPLNQSLNHLSLKSNENSTDEEAIEFTLNISLEKTNHKLNLPLSIDSNNTTVDYENEKSPCRNNGCEIDLNELVFQNVNENTLSSGISNCYDSQQTFSHFGRQKSESMPIQNVENEDLQILNHISKENSNENDLEDDLFDQENEVNRSKINVKDTNNTISRLVDKYLKVNKRNSRHSISMSQFELESEFSESLSSNFLKSNQSLEEKTSESSSATALLLTDALVSPQKRKGSKNKNSKNDMAYLLEKFKSPIKKQLTSLEAQRENVLEDVVNEASNNISKHESSTSSTSEHTIDLTQDDNEDSEEEDFGCLMLSDDEINYSIWKSNKSMKAHNKCGTPLKNNASYSSEDSKKDLGTSNEFSSPQQDSLNSKGSSANDSKDYSLLNLLKDPKKSIDQKSDYKKTHLDRFKTDFDLNNDDEDDEPISNDYLLTSPKISTKLPHNSKSSCSSLEHTLAKERAEFGIMESHSESFIPSQLEPVELDKSSEKNDEEIADIWADCSFLQSPSEQIVIPIKRKSEKFNSLIKRISSGHPLNDLDDFDEFDLLVSGGLKDTQQERTTLAKTPTDFDQLLTAQISFNADSSKTSEQFTGSLTTSSRKTKNHKRSISFHCSPYTDEQINELLKASKDLNIETFMTSEKVKSPRSPRLKRSKSSFDKSSKTSEQTANKNNFTTPQDIEVNGRTYCVRIVTEEKPDFTKFSEAELLKRLYNFGIKPLKRKQAVKLLEYIYNQTHPVLLPETKADNGSPKDGKTSAKEPIGISQKLIQSDENNLQPNELPAVTLNSSDKLNLKDCLGHQLLKFRNDLYACLVDEDEEYIFQTNITKKTPQPLLPFHIAWYNLLCSNPALHESIVMYEAIDLQEIFLFFKSIGYRYDPKDMRNFLDRRCIIFRYDLTPTNTQGSKNHQVRNPKQIGKRKKQK